MLPSRGVPLRPLKFVLRSSQGSVSYRLFLSFHVPSGLCLCGLHTVYVIYSLCSLNVLSVWFKQFDFVWSPMLSQNQGSVTWCTKKKKPNPSAQRRDIVYDRGAQAWLLE